MAVTTAKNVAAHLIAMSRERFEDITNLKLQKLLYYSQAWHLAFYDCPLFDDRIEAWVHGPVVPPVFGEFKRFRWSPIDETPACVAVSEEPGAQEHMVAHLSEIVNVYGNFTANELERMTHQESPWLEARGATPPDESSNAIISHESMRRCYRSE